MFLKQSTTFTDRIGPFLDKTDGVTEEVGLTTANTAIFLSKAGGDFAAKTETTSLVHDQDGWYIILYDATDTATVGKLEVMIQAPATHLPVWKTYWVLEEAIFDALFAASANAFNGAAGSTAVGLVDLVTTTTTNTDMVGTDNAATAADLLDKLGAVNEAAAAGDPSATESVMQYVKQIVNVLVGTTGVTTWAAGAAPANNVSLAEGIRKIAEDIVIVDGNVDDVETNTNDWNDGGRLDLLLDAIKAKTDSLTFGVPGNVDSNLQSINELTDLVDRLHRLIQGVVTGLVDDAGASTTAFVVDSVNMTFDVDDRPIGRVLTFTEGASIEGESTEITDFDQGTLTITVNELTAAPANNDPFVIQ